MTTSKSHQLHNLIPSELPGGLDVVLEEQPTRRDIHRDRRSGKSSNHAASTDLLSIILRLKTKYTDRLLSIILMILMV